MSAASVNLSRPIVMKGLEASHHRTSRNVDTWLYRLIHDVIQHPTGAKWPWCELPLLPILETAPATDGCRWHVLLRRELPKLLHARTRNEKRKLSLASLAHNNSGLREHGLHRIFLEVRRVAVFVQEAFHHDFDLAQGTLADGFQSIVTFLFFTWV